MNTPDHPLQPLEAYCLSGLKETLHVHRGADERCPQLELELSREGYRRVVPDLYADGRVVKTSSIVLYVLRAA